MSDLLYPLGLISALRTRRVDRVVRDEFEAGNTTARRLWAAYYFKRTFELQHAELTFEEWRYLRSFYASHGTYDSFMFRDNVNRGGTARVRFVNELTEERGPATYLARVALEETTSKRQLPEVDEIITAAGRAPVLWYDANREFYQRHLDTIYLDRDGTAFDAAYQRYPAPWTGTLDLGFVLGSHQTYQFNPGGGVYAKTAVDLEEFASGATPATIFLITNGSAEVYKQVLFAIGSQSAGAAFGLALTSTNYYEPWLGGSETWTNARFLNSTPGTYRSLAVTRPAGGSTSLYTYGALTGADANGHAACPGPAVLGAAFNGFNSMTNGNVANVLLFDAALNLTQIQALHNLFAYQFDMTEV